MRCISSEKIERLLNLEMASEEYEDVFSHLENCAKCAGKVVTYVTFEEALLELFRKVKVNKKIRLRAEKNCPGDKLLLGYATGVVDKKNMESIENHLRKCDACIVRVQNFQIQRNRSEADTEVTAQASASRLKPVDKSFHVYLEDKGGAGFELVSCSGVPVSDFVLEGGARGARAKKSRAIKLRKDFQDKGISLQLTISKTARKDACDIKFSMLGLKKNNVFATIKGGDVKLIGMGISEKIAAGVDGTVDFASIPIGNYRIKAPAHDVEIDLKIKVLKE